MLARCRVPVLRRVLHAARGLAPTPPGAPPVPPPPPHAAASQRSLVLCAAAAARGPAVADLFGDDVGSSDDDRPLSRTASKKRSDEFRQAGRDLTTLPPKTLDRMALPSDLREAVDEHTRIGGKRGTGANKKGRARVEALMAQILRSYPPERSARVVNATNAAMAGLPFQPVSPSGGAARPRAARAPAPDSAEAAAERVAESWLRGLLAGDADVSTEVFGAVAAPAADGLPAPGVDRVQLRQLVMKAQAEERAAAEAAAAAAAKAAEAAAAAAAAAAEAGTVLQLQPPPLPPPAKRKLPPAARQLLQALTPLARRTLDDDDDAGSSEESGDEDSEEGSSSDEDEKQ